MTLLDMFNVLGKLFSKLRFHVFFSSWVFLSQSNVGLINISKVRLSKKIKVKLGLDFALLNFILVLLVFPVTQLKNVRVYKPFPQCHLGGKSQHSFGFGIEILVHIYGGLCM